MSEQNPATDRHPEILTTQEVDSLPTRLLEELPGVENRLLFSDGTQMAGRLTIAGGHALGAHTHRDKQHHFWVLEGEADVLGKRVSSGSYVHIPPGFEHDIDATSTEGCTIFYLYLPLPPG